MTHFVLEFDSPGLKPVSQPSSGVPVSLPRLSTIQTKSGQISLCALFLSLRTAAEPAGEPHAGGRVCHSLSDCTRTREGQKVAALCYEGGVREAVAANLQAGRPTRRRQEMSKTENKLSCVIFNHLSCLVFFYGFKHCTCSIIS